MTEQKSNISIPRLALAGLMLAVSFCILLYDNVFKLIPLGLNVPLSLVVFYLSVGVLYGRQFARGARHTAAHLVFIAFLAIPFALTNNPALLTISAILIILLVGEQVMLSFQKTLYDPYSICFIGDSLAFWFSFSFGGVRGSFTQYKGCGKSRFTGILLGLAITIPVLLAVIPLLMSGDAVFSRLFTDLFGGLQWNDIVGNILVALLLFILGSGLLWSLTGKSRARNNPAPVPAPQKNAAFNQTASLLLLSVLGAVLIVFCAIQFLYLFSGRVPEGLTYADYARSGFWQLLAVAVIVITLVFLLLRFGAPCSRSALNVRKGLMALLLVCTLVLLFSSFSRMALYEQSFGFSRLRLFTQFFMVALFAFLVISIIHLWVPRASLKKGAFFCFLICYVALTFWNIDGFIARENAKNQGEAADLTYLTSLGPDALPYYIDLLSPDDFTIEVVSEDDYAYNSEQNAHNRQYLENGKALLYQNPDALIRAYYLSHVIRDVEVSDDWRYLNVGRGRAKEALTTHPELVERVTAIRDLFQQP